MKECIAALSSSADVSVSIHGAQAVTFLVCILCAVAAAAAGGWGGVLFETR